MKISTDNPLFNAIMNPSAALQATVDDFLESLKQSTDLAYAEIINLVLRTCGCNDTVDVDEAVDYDGVVDALDNFTEVLKQDDSPTYPLTSKLPIFKRFNKSLSEFIERLVVTTAESGVFYSSELMKTISEWVIPMSSSQIRSFRHTATVFALEILTALADVTASVEKQEELVSRQRQGDKKRQANQGGGAVREKGLDKKAAALAEQRKVLSDHINNLVTTVFIHRYRDLDPGIRAECVRAIGLWFSKYPAHFLDTSYLRYVGWVLSDQDHHVRLEAVKSLTNVYRQEAYIGSLTQFTERFKPRLLEMAQGDVDLPVRIAVIKVLTSIDENTLLEDEERDQLGLLVFDSEPRIRKAVVSFVHGVWNEEVESILVDKEGSDEEKSNAGIKALARLLIRWTKELDDEDAEADEDDDTEGGASFSSPQQMSSLVGANVPSRIDLVVEALWDQVDSVADWEALLKFLLLDHSASTDQFGGKPPSRSRRDSSVERSLVDEAWRLEEAEEAMSLEVLAGSIKHAVELARNDKKGEDEDAINDVTRELIKALPRLISKHQTDAHRIGLILLLPPLMNLDMYLEMRLMTAYGNLWDDISKQFLTYSSKSILTRAVNVIQHMLAAKSLANMNGIKITELEEQLSTLLRDTIAGRDEVEMTTFSEDEIQALGGLCSRLASLATVRDPTAWMEESEDGKQSSAWDIISALVERGRLGHQEEGLLVDQAISVLSLHVMWKSHGLASIESVDKRTQSQELLQEQRDGLLDKLMEYCIGEESTAVNGIKQTAFDSALNMYMLFSPVHAEEEASPLAALTLDLDEQMQFRCAGFMQAQIEQYLDEVSGHSKPAKDSADSDDSSDEEEDATNKKAKAAAKANERALNPATIHQDYQFMRIMYTYLRALHSGVLNPTHCTALLAYHGRFGDASSTCSKAIAEILRQEGIHRQNGDVVVHVITKSLTESFTAFLDGAVVSEENTISLAKLLLSCLVVRGAQLAIVARLDEESIVDIQMELLTWIGKRLTAYQADDNRRGRKRATRFFRVLLPLLAALPRKDALRLKAHMEQVLSDAKVDTSLPIWEPQKAYEKRLLSSMTKIKGRAAGRKAPVATDDEGTDGEGAGANPTDNEAGPAPAAQKPRPKPRPRARKRRKTNGSDAEDDGSGDEAPPASGKLPTRRSARRRGTSSAPEASGDEQVPASLAPARTNGHTNNGADDSMDVDEEADVDGASQVSNPWPAPSSRASTPANEAPARRKRVRH
ncbi:hypothetical protein BDV98DRAFT_563241 [Pterulicium gracile]|uniref:SCD domain-containing protein n=1 Tax=Pterulicium gracile TaxID=1884261 RepID=A0A5C3QPX9_9AGAR|nr:hypothetical protein BDV98DRAFT_563241 [Pterula gracilis]